MLFYRIFPAIAAGCAALMDIQRAKVATMAGCFFVYWSVCLREYGK